MVGPYDLDLIHLTDDVDEAVAHIRAADQANSSPANGQLDA